MKMVKEENKVRVEHVNVPGLVILMIGCVVFMAWSIYKIAEDRHFTKSVREQRVL